MTMDLSLDPLDVETVPDFLLDNDKLHAWVDGDPWVRNKGASRVWRVVPAWRVTKYQPTSSWAPNEQQSRGVCSESSCGRGARRPNVVHV